MQGAADDVSARLIGDFPGSRVAVTSFKDVGDPYVYRVDADFTSSSAAVGSTYAGMTAGDGGDTPEAQLTAMLNAANGSGLSYHSGTDRIFIIATDADYHTYVDIATLKTTFEANHIIPIFAVTSGQVGIYEKSHGAAGHRRGRHHLEQQQRFCRCHPLRPCRSRLRGHGGGGSGDDTILGGDGFYDAIFGLGGADSLYGLGGDDVLDGGAGDDHLYGGTGADRVVGGVGKGFRRWRDRRSTRSRATKAMTVCKVTRSATPDPESSRTQREPFFPIFPAPSKAPV
jgi:hypothetical protein